MDPAAAGAGTGLGTGGGAGAAAGAAGQLIVSGGGSTMVATDDVLAEAAVLRHLHEAAADWAGRLSRIRSLDDTPAPAWRPSDPGPAVFEAELAASTVGEHAGHLADALDQAAENYGEAERLATLLLRSSSAFSAYVLGRLAPLLAVLAVPAVTSTALIATVLAWLFPGVAGRGEAADGTTGDGEPASAHPAPGDATRQRDVARILTNPVFVQAVRLLVSSADDAAAGSAGVPLPVPFLLGDEGLGVLGVPTSAAALLGLARPLGRLRESPVTARRTAVKRAPPPQGLAGLASRIPRAAAGAPQVRIERYGTTRPTWVVYSGGTIDWSASTSREPWDLTSNLSAVAKQESGSYRTVVQAMKAAGVRPGDPVVQVGHSQGGLVAARVAASGEFNTVAVATFGAPAGQVPVPPEVPMIATEHSDDLVPALGGTPRDVTGPGNEHLVVRREAFAGDSLPEGQYLPAHDMDAYEQTARLEDASAEPRIATFRQQLAQLVGEEPGEVTLWRGERTDEPAAR